MCCSVLQCVAGYNSVLWCVAVRCSALQCVAACCSVLQCFTVYCSVFQWAYSWVRGQDHPIAAVCCSVLQALIVCCSALQCVAVCCRLWQCVAVWCSVVQCGAMRCNVLQCVAVCCSMPTRELGDKITRQLQHVAVCCRLSYCKGTNKFSFMITWNYESLLRQNFQCKYIFGRASFWKQFRVSLLSWQLYLRLSAMGWLRLVGSLKS